MNEEGIANMVKNLLILSIKPKNISRKILMILRKNIQFSQNFIWRNQMALLVKFTKKYVSQKTLSYILKNMLMLFFSIMVLC